MLEDGAHAILGSLASLLDANLAKLHMERDHTSIYNISRHTNSNNDDDNGVEQSEKK